MSALLEGFRTGWGAVNQYYQQEENKRRYDQGFERQQQQDVLLNQIRQIQIDQGQSQSALLAGQVADMPNQQEFINNQRKYQSALGADNVAISDNKVKQIPEINDYNKQRREFDLKASASQNAILDNTVSRLPKTNQMTDDMNALNLNSAKLQFGQQKNQALWGDLQQIINTGGKDLPELIGEFVANNDLTGTNMASFGTIEGIKSAVAMGNAFDSGDLESALPAVNTFLKPQLIKNIGKPGKDGNPISNIEITGIKIEGEGFKIPIMVTTQGGNKYPSFISELRSADPNDPERFYSANELIGTLKSAYSAGKLLQGSSYYQRLIQNAQNVRAAEQPQNKGNYKAVTGAMGNTTGYFDPNTQKFVPLPEGALGNTMATSVEEVQENKANVVEQQRQNMISGYSNAIAQKFADQGISPEESNTIAKNVADRMSAATDAGTADQLDENMVMQEETQKYIKVREQLKIDHAAQNKNVYKGVSAFDNNPYSNWK